MLVATEDLAWISERMGVSTEIDVAGLIPLAMEAARCRVQRLAAGFGPHCWQACCHRSNLTPGF